MKRFRATVEPTRGGGHFAVVPPAVATALGLGSMSRVCGTLAGTAYRSSIMMNTGVHYLGVHKATIKAAGIAVGDVVAVTIDKDDQPRETDVVPPDLAKALAKTKGAKAAFEALAPSHKREHVKYILEAKQAETRARRIAKTIDTLAARRRK